MKVLFADDSQTMRKVAEYTFATEGYELFLVEGGAGVVEGVKRNIPHVAIIDADMPGVDGYEACRQLRQDPQTSSVPVLLLTGPSIAFDGNRAREVGVSDHIDKPFETQALYDKVKAIASAPAQPQAAQQMAPPAAVASPKPPAPAIKEAPPAGRAPKLGGQTVLGLGNMGYAPPQKAPGVPQKSAQMPPGQTPQGQMPPGQMPPGQMPQAQQRPKAKIPPSGLSAPRPAPIASPIPRPKSSPQKMAVPVAKPAQKPAMPAQRPAPAAQKVPKPPAAKPVGAPPAKPAAGPADLPSMGAPAEKAPAEKPKPAAPSASAVTPEQMDALKSVAREVIEQVVWEVVPDLAETIIREEIAKLLKE